MQPRVLLLGMSLMLCGYVINMSETFLTPELYVAENGVAKETIVKPRDKHNKMDISDLNRSNIRHEDIDTQSSDKKPEQENFVDPYMIKDPPYNRRS